MDCLRLLLQLPPICCEAWGVHRVGSLMWCEPLWSSPPVFAVQWSSWSGIRVSTPSAFTFSHRCLCSGAKIEMGDHESGSVCLPACVSGSGSTYVLAYLSACLSPRTVVCALVRRSTCTVVCLSICLPVCLPAFLPPCLHASVFICLPVCLSVRRRQLLWRG